MSNLITTCLWFESAGREAAELYCEAFGDSGIESGNPFLTAYSLRGSTFWNLSAGPKYRPNESISMFVRLDRPDELDRAFGFLSTGGRVVMEPGTYSWSERYAWIEDRWGVSWQLFVGDDGTRGNAVSPALCFGGENSGRACEAVDLYTSIFSGSGIISMTHYDEQDDQPTKYLKHGIFRLGNNIVRAFDTSAESGAAFTEGVSLVVGCETQDEVDHYWHSLTSDGGAPGRCGWLKDRFGVSWQIVPTILGSLMNDPATAQKVGAVLVQMDKLVISELEAAAE